MTTRRDKIHQQFLYELSGTAAAKKGFTEGLSSLIGNLTDAERADYFSTLHTALLNGLLTLADEVDALEVSLRSSS